MKEAPGAKAKREDKLQGDSSFNDLQNKHFLSLPLLNLKWSMVNGLLFHMTQPTSRSIIKAIVCSKPTISEH